MLIRTRIASKHCLVTTKVRCYRTLQMRNSWTNANRAGLVEIYQAKHQENKNKWTRWYSTNFSRPHYLKYGFRPIAFIAHAHFQAVDHANFVVRLLPILFVNPECVRIKSLIQVVSHLLLRPILIHRPSAPSKSRHTITRNTCFGPRRSWNSIQMFMRITLSKALALLWKFWAALSDVGLRLILPVTEGMTRTTKIVLTCDHPLRVKILCESAFLRAHLSILTYFARMTYCFGIAKSLNSFGNGMKEFAFDHNRSTCWEISIVVNRLKVKPSYAKFRSYIRIRSSGLSVISNVGCRIR